MVKRLHPRTTLAISLALGSLVVLSGSARQNRAQSAQASTDKSVLEMDVIPRTPERLERGKYLVEGVLQCWACHSDNDFSKRPFEPLPGKKFGGFVFPNEEIGVPDPNRIVAPNISPDPEFGAGKWTDAMFVRALRQGIGHDGRTLFPLMPYPFFRSLSDEDLASVIVYVRSAAPAHVEQPKIQMSEDLKKSFQPLPPLPHVPEPDRSDKVAYGKYLVNAGHCTACHATTDDKGNNVDGMDFAGGGPLIGAWEGGGKVLTVNALNITPDASGIGYFSEGMFIEVMRNGGFKNRPLSNIMPWTFFRNLTDDDLKAMFAYLQTLKPVCHHVDNTENASYCKVCKAKHGLGEMNEVLATK